MFGGRRNNNNNNDRGGGESLSKVMTPDGGANKNNKSSVTGFDPEGLERAAKAARELDSSRNASSAIELIKTQEVTKQVCYVMFVDYDDDNGFLFAFLPWLIFEKHRFSFSLLSCLAKKKNDTVHVM